MIRRIAQQCARLVYASLAGVGLVAILLAVVLWRSVTELGPEKVTSGARASFRDATQNPGVLHLSLQGRLARAERAPGRWDWIRTTTLKESPADLDQMLDALRSLAHVAERQGVLVQLSSPQLRWDARIELSEALLKVREQHHVVIWASHLSAEDLPLLAAATETYLAPSGRVDFVGRVLRPVYVGDALKKLGIWFDVIHVGAYKSAGESFVRMGPSEAARQAMQALVTDSNAVVCKQALEIAGKARRSWTSAQLKDWMQMGDMTPREAVAKSVVNQVASFAEIQTKLAAEFPGGSFKPPLEGADKPAHLMTWLRRPQPVPPVAEAIGLVDIHGAINWSGSGDGEGTSALEITEALEWMRNEDSIKGVLLRINSPGGGVLAADELWSQVRQLQEVKPVVASLLDVAASGGYYVASAATRIVAQPLTVTGSIGVVALRPSLHGLLQKMGVTMQTVPDSEATRRSDWSQPLTRGELRRVEGLLENAYERFVERVSVGRGLSRETVKSWAAGRVYLAGSFSQAGLVDSLAGETGAEQLLLELAGLPTGKTPVYVRYGMKKFSLWSAVRELSWVSGMLAQVASSVWGKPQQNESSYRGVQLRAESLYLGLFAGVGGEL